MLGLGLQELLIIAGVIAVLVVLYKISRKGK